MLVIDCCDTTTLVTIVVPEVEVGAAVVGRVYILPLWVMPLPGNKVCVPMTKPEFELAVRREEPTLMTAGGWVEKGAGVAVAVIWAPLIITAPPLAAMDIS